MRFGRAAQTPSHAADAPRRPEQGWPGYPLGPAGYSRWSTRSELGRGPSRSLCRERETQLGQDLANDARLLHGGDHAKAPPATGTDEQIDFRPWGQSGQLLQELDGLAVSGKVRNDQMPPTARVEGYFKELNN